MDRPSASYRLPVAGCQWLPSVIGLWLLVGLTCLAASELREVSFGTLRLQIPVDWQALPSASPSEARYGPAGSDLLEPSPEHLQAALRLPQLGLSLREAAAPDAAAEAIACRERLLQVNPAARIDLLQPRELAGQRWQVLRVAMPFHDQQLAMHLWLTHLPDGSCLAIGLRGADDQWLQDFFESLRFERTTQD